MQALDPTAEPPPGAFDVEQDEPSTTVPDASALTRRVTLRVGRNARPVSSGPSGPTRRQRWSAPGRLVALGPYRLAGIAAGVERP
jgi:hypothetical protein